MRLSSSIASLKSLITIMVLVGGCLTLLLRAPFEGERAHAQAMVSSDGATVSVELGLMLPTFPRGRPPEAAEVALGKELFADPVLSVDSTISCASCHAPEDAFADPRPVSLGVGGQQGTRNSPTLWNVAFLEKLSWDGRHQSLEEQTLAAISNPKEMGLDIKLIKGRVEKKYGLRLRKIYGDIAAEEAVAKAIASFQRILVAGDSPFDRYMYGGQENAISAAAKRGFKLFLGDGRCVQCHTIRCEECHPFGGSTALFTDDRFHNIGVGFSEKGDVTDWGRFAVTSLSEDRGGFRTPTLRNIELTAPYMHDGSMKTLDEVIEHYNKGGNPNPNLDPDVQPLSLSDQEKQDLVEYLKTLTSYKLLKAAERK